VAAGYGHLCNLAHLPPRSVLHSRRGHTPPFNPKQETPLARPPNFKQEKQRREDKQRKKNEEKQRKAAERKESNSQLPKPPEEG
jgi:hypothetical protein